MTRPSAVALVGAVPPPLHGFSWINQQLAERLGQRSDTRVLPTSPRGTGALYHAEKIGKAVAVLIALCSGRRRGGAVVIGLDGDDGAWLNLLQAHLARALGYRLFLYHHSVGWMAGTTRVMRALTSPILGEAVHVMCSGAMAERFRDLYGWRGAILVVSNVAYVAAPTARQARRLPSGRLTLGFLSNLMRLKGVLLAVEALRVLERRGIDARLLVAGPFVEADVEAELRAAARELGDRLRLLGPVAGEAKKRFFADTDVFLFPTLHPTETQSLVVPEAQAAGIPVIARAQNFVAESLPPGWPGLIDPTGDFPRQAADLVARWLDDPGEYRRLSGLALAQAASLKAEADRQLAEFLACVCQA